MKSRSWLYSVVVVAALALLPFTACALDLIPDFLKFGKDKERVVWEGLDQYVKLVPQDELPDGESPPPNQHPVELNVDDLKTVLGSITLWKEEGMFSEAEGYKLFNPSQSSLLARKLAEAFAKARPDEDVTFALMGLQDALVVGKDKVSTAGRAFYLNDRLNIIIGDMHRVYTYGKEKDITGHELNVDRRKYPHNPGARRKARAQPARMMSAPGMEFYESDDGLRGDWLVIDLAAAAEGIRQEAVPEEIARETRKVKEEAAKLAIERRQMREELARLRQQMDEMSQSSGDTGVASLEQRLERLEALRRKGLISEQEYQAKRKEILDDI